MPHRTFRFQAPDRQHVWKNLALTMSQAAALTGVSERQIQHWMDQGYIEPAGEGNRRINGDNLDRIMLIRQARMAGIPLRQSVALAEEFLHNEAFRTLDTDVAPSALRDLGERLHQAQVGIESVQQMIEIIDSRNGKVPGR